MRYPKKFVIRVAIFGFFLIALFYFKQNYLQQKEEQAKPTIRQERVSDDWKVILLYTPHIRSNNLWSFIMRDIIFGTCPESRCRITLDKSKISEADAVLFCASNLRYSRSEYLEISKERKPNQVWIFLSAESPPNLLRDTQIKIKDMDDIFNWTMTYRRDSDVLYPYGRVIPRATASSEMIKKQPIEFQARKNVHTPVSWMASNCPTHSRREDLTKQLQMYIPIDVYGKCGPKKCSSPDIESKLWSLNEIPCAEVIRSYYFNLAFENSLCTDLVSEKFYRALYLGVVPVIMEGEYYESIAPPHSFINAKDFDSPQSLATYLKTLVANPIEYKKYLEWRKDYVIELGHPYAPRTCNLCAKLHEKPRLHKVYSDMNKWYHEMGDCHPWEWRKKNETVDTPLT